MKPSWGRVDPGAETAAAMKFDDVYPGLRQLGKLLAKSHLHQRVHTARLQSLSPKRTAQSRYAVPATSPPRLDG